MRYGRNVSTFLSSTTFKNHSEQPSENRSNFKASQYLPILSKIYSKRINWKQQPPCREIFFSKTVSIHELNINISFQSFIIQSFIAMKLA